MAQVHEMVAVIGLGYAGLLLALLANRRDYEL